MLENQFPKYPTANEARKLISEREINNLKKLARIEFGEKETEDLVGDLGNILNFVERLKEADVSNISENLGNNLKNVFRADEKPIEFDEEKIGKLISQFPEKEKTYLKVKAVIKK